MIPNEELIVEYRRLEALAARSGEGPGRAATLGWDLEYPSSATLRAFVDHVLFRRMNDFLPDRERPVILDCGANIGYTVLHYKRQFPGARITAFEPDPQFVPLLRRNLERNGAGDVQVVESAAWIADGHAKWVMEGTDGSRLLTRASARTTTVEVATVDLLRFLDREIDLLKVDIEGAEFEVVPHIAPRLGNVKNILVECHIADQSKYDALARVLTTLTAAGFKISLNSYGPWRDLIRRHVPAPLHAEQYMLVAGWRIDHPGVSRDPSYMPYTGLPHHGEHLQVSQVLADVATGHGSRQVLRMNGPFWRENGLCWIWRFPASTASGDTPGCSNSETFILENGRMLGPSHALHADIREKGGGLYSHWGSQLYLSTSDSSNPNTNGRTYTAICRGLA